MTYFKAEENYTYSDGSPRYSTSRYAVGHRDTNMPGHIRSTLYTEVSHSPRRESIFYDNQNEYGHTLRRYDKNEQMELFKHVVQPAYSRVSYVAGTERGRTHFPLLLGIASNDAMRITGAQLTPDDDLSKHSIKAVENLKNRGLISKSIDTPDEPTNEMTFYLFPFASAPGEYEELSSDETKAGKDTIRGLLRKGKNLSSQFDPITKPQPEPHTQLELGL